LNSPEDRRAPGEWIQIGIDCEFVKFLIFAFRRFFMGRTIQYFLILLALCVWASEGLAAISTFGDLSPGAESYWSDADDGTLNVAVSVLTGGLDIKYDRKANQGDIHPADFGFKGPENDYLLTEWAWVDMAALGAVSGLEFALQSSNDIDGIRNFCSPGYFAIDHLTTMPLPGAVWCIGGALLGVLGFRKRNTNHL
jgi:hypothetical protein